MSSLLHYPMFIYFVSQNIIAEFYGGEEALVSAVRTMFMTGGPAISDENVKVTCQKHMREGQNVP